MPAREDFSFLSGGVRCAAWLCRPPEASACVVMAQKAPNAELTVLAGVGHFEPYTGDVFERVVSEQVDFLTRQLRPRAPSEPPSPLHAPPSPAG
jgi:hypothetical protein